MSVMHYGPDRILFCHVCNASPAFASPAWQSMGDRLFQEMPLLVVGAMPVLIKNSGYTTAQGTLLCQSIFPTSTSSGDKTQET